MSLTNEEAFRAIHKELMRIKARMNKIHGRCPGPDADGCPQQGGRRKKSRKSRRRKRTKKKTRKSRRKTKKKRKRRGGASQKKLNINHNKIIGKNNIAENNVPNEVVTLGEPNNATWIEEGAFQPGDEVEYILSQEPWNRATVIAPDFPPGHYIIEMHYPSDEGEILVYENEIRHI